jgi:hypothetical protein
MTIKSMVKIYYLDFIIQNIVKYTVHIFLKKCLQQIVRGEAEDKMLFVLGNCHRHVCKKTILKKKKKSNFIRLIRRLSVKTRYINAHI